MVHAGTISADDLPDQIVTWNYDTMTADIVWNRSGSTYVHGDIIKRVTTSPIDPGWWWINSDYDRGVPCLNIADQINPVLPVSLHLGSTVLTRNVPSEDWDRFIWRGGGHILYWSLTGWGWVLDGHAKTGYQNSPIGTYSGGAVVTA